MDQPNQEKMTMNYLHGIVKDLSVKENFQEAQIKENRKQLLTKIKRVQELRCLSSLRSGYFLKLNSSNVSYVSQLPFMNQNNFHVSERIVEMAGISTIRNQVNKLIKEILSEQEDVTKFLATLDFKNDRFKPENRTYLPEGITIKEYFCCCTIPALFGFSFTSEFQLSFLNFLSQVAENIPSTVYEKSIGDHWIIDCMKYYFHSLNIGEYIRSSIGDIILHLIRDESLLHYALKKNFVAILSKVDQYIPLMISGLIENLSIIPNSIRSLLKKISKIGKTQNRPYPRLFTLFMDCILIPSLTNLKAYNVLPPSFHLDPSPNGPMSIIQAILALFKFVFNLDVLRKKFVGFEPKTISSAKMSSFLISLIDIDDGFRVNGPKIVELLPALELHCLFLLFSEPDIFILTDVFMSPGAPESIQKVAQNIPTNVTDIPLDFFRHEVWEFKAYNIVKPSIPDDTPKKLTDPVEIAGDALFKFLSFARIDSGAPNNLDMFIEYFEKQMIIQRNYLTEAYIRHFDCVAKQITKTASFKNENKDNGEKFFITALQKEIERHTEKTGRLKVTNNELNHQIRIVKSSIDTLEHQSSDSLPFLCSNLLTLFINSIPQFTIDLVLKKEDILLQPAAFFDFMQENLVTLKDFIVPIAEYALDEVARHLHTFVMQKLSYNEFRSFKRTYQRFDKIFMKDSDSILNCLCVSQAPENLVELFKKRELFDVIINVVRKAMLLEIPLETVREIAKAFDLIKVVKEVETDVKITHDELTLAFNFVLLSASIPTLYSMGKYVQQYLVNIPMGDVVFLTEKENDVLKIFCYQITQLDQVLSDF